jgi:hypothetical protein
MNDHNFGYITKLGKIKKLKNNNNKKPLIQNDIHQLQNI